MTDFYPYLISSLPALNFDMKPPFSFKDFLQKCFEFIPSQDYAVLQALPKTEEAVGKKVKHPIIKEWISFDSALRNELVKIRASHKHIDAGKYIRPDGYSGPAISHIALTAHRNISIQEAEKFLDGERWNFLDSLALGHYFDLGFLIVYAYKLLILERWQRIRTADRQALLDKALHLSGG